VTGLEPGPFGLTAVVTAAALLILQGLTFAVAVKIKKNSVVDTDWGVGIALAALTAFLTSVGHGQPGRRYLLLVASLRWGARLAGYIGWRNHGKPEDPRYQDMLAKANGNTYLYALRKVYLLQAAVLFAVGFFFESTGDWQLYRFKADPASQGQIMDRGLWHYTRHPNYFGDFCMWWGLFAIAYGSWQELPALVAPLLMTFILTRGTGASMTDRRMKAARPGYADYIERTSGFFPLPPRRRPRAAGPAQPGRG
jgi:steroid 5-alpha reductase family enzyme